MRNKICNENDVGISQLTFSASCLAFKNAHEIVGISAAPSVNKQLAFLRDNVEIELSNVHITLAAHWLESALVVFH